MTATESKEEKYECIVCEGLGRTCDLSKGESIECYNCGGSGEKVISDMDRFEIISALETLKAKSISREAVIDCLNEALEDVPMFSGKYEGIKRALVLISDLPQAADNKDSEL